MLRDKKQLVAELAKNSTAGFREGLKHDKKLWKARWEIVNKLMAVRLWPDIPESATDCAIRWGERIEVQVEDLPKLRAVFPKVADNGNYSLHDPDKRTIKVYLDLGQDGIEIYYLKTLPEDAKCKIVTQECPASSYTTLVCNVSE